MYVNCHIYLNHSKPSYPYMHWRGMSQSDHDFLHLLKDQKYVICKDKDKDKDTLYFTLVV